ncbi:hypothetical protein ACFXTO_035179 [Malus domestica]
MITWMLWKNRNEMVWNGAGLLLQEVVVWSENWLQEYKKWHKMSLKKSNRPVQRWSKPSVGWVKCNFDGGMGAKWDEMWLWGDFA